MANLLTIAETIVIGDISVALMSNDVTRGSLFGERKVNDNAVILLAYVTDALRWHNEDFPSDTTLRGVANYTRWLCGSYGIEARAGSTGGGSVVPITPRILTPSRQDFYATDSTLLVIGQSSAVFTNWIGYNLQFERGNVPQATANNGTDSYFTWNKTTGAFFCYGAVTDGELISLIPYL